MRVVGDRLLGGSARAPVAVRERAERLPLPFLRGHVLVEYDHPRVGIPGMKVGMSDTAEEPVEEAGGCHGLTLRCGIRR